MFFEPFLTHLPSQLHHFLQDGFCLLDVLLLHGVPDGLLVLLSVLPELVRWDREEDKQAIRDAMKKKNIQETEAILEEMMKLGRQMCEKWREEQG